MNNISNGITGMMTYPTLLLNSNNRAIFTYRCFVCIHRVIENLFFLNQSQTMLSLDDSLYLQSA